MNGKVLMAEFCDKISNILKHKNMDTKNEEVL